jgi:hypothetical protein
MPFHPRHDVGRGIHRLLMAPQDVPVRQAIPWRDPPPALSAAPPPHQALYAEYVGFLEEAVEIAEEWWDNMVQVAVDGGLPPADAERAVLHRVFSGPAAAGEVVWTLRTYWLRCAALNDEVKAEQRIPPQVLLLRWLVDAGRTPLVNVLTGMPYWPIGTDEKGNWA